MLEILAAIACCVLAHPPAGGVLASSDDFSWEWALAPQLVGEHESLYGNAAGCNYSLVRSVSGGLAISISSPVVEIGGEEVVDGFKPMLLDKKGRLIGDFEALGSSQIPGVSHAVFAFDDLQMANPAAMSIAIARYPMIRLRHQSQKLAEHATAQGRSILPWPLHGKPYRFDLQTSHGRIASEQLCGKVVLIVCWSSTDPNLSQRMLAIEELLCRPECVELVALGVCFDTEPGSGEQAAERLGLTWPQTFAASERSDDRDALRRMSGTRRLPNTLFVNRNGMLIGSHSAPALDTEWILRIVNQE